MEGSTEPIAVRIARMNNLILGKTSSQSTQSNVGKFLAREGLLDAFTLLYDECNNETLRRDKNVSRFLAKFRDMMADTQRLRVNLSDFEVKKLIGRGHFGEVQLVKEKQTGDVYAMKTLKKSEALKQESVALYEEERDIMAEATSPWLTKLQYAFQDNSMLYLVMEFHPGGDLAALLDRHDGLIGEDLAKFYLAELTLAIHALHSMNYAHRDIKPDNVLLDRLGHVKLADFGSAAKLGPGGLISSHMPVGTPEYIAPEVLRSMEGTSKNKRPSAYGKECDYWSLGIVAYEMVYGKTPFAGDQLLETYCNIMNHKKNLKFLEQGSINFRNCVRGLLEDANARITHEQIIQHSFFASVDWSNLRLKVPPIVPLVNGVDDTSNFIVVSSEIAHLSSSDSFPANTKGFTGRNLPFVGFTYAKQFSNQMQRTSNEKSELVTQLENKRRELQDYQKKLLSIEDKATTNTIQCSSLELRLEEKSKRLEASNRERDKLERELTKARSDIAGMKRTLDLERQERRDLETRALDLIKGAKRKWETAEKDKVAQLNKHIEAQTMRITELCTYNNEMTSRLQRAECELKTANAELEKLRAFQIQYKESLAKTRELSRQSVAGVESKLEEMASRAHNQLADIRAKLEIEMAKNADLETQLRNEQDSNHCRQSRLNVALELSQSELKDCQEQLRSVQASIPARDAEIEALRNQLKERTEQLDGIAASNQRTATLQENLERLKLENRHLKQQLELAKSDLSDTVVNLEETQSLAQDLERVSQDKAALQRRLQDTLEKEEEYLQKVGNLEELLRRFEHSVTKLEAENVSLKQSDHQMAGTSSISLVESEQKNAFLEQQLQRVEQQLQTARENAAAERQAAKQAQSTLWKKEKELSDANLDKRIASREAKTAEEKIKVLTDEKQKISDKLSARIADEESRSKKLLKELEGARHSLAEATKEASRNKLHADSAQRALTQANKQMEELQSSSSSLRRELDATRKQMRTNQDRVDTLNSENKRLTVTITKLNEEKIHLESQLEKLQQEGNSYQLNFDLLKETCTVLEEQLTDYERLTSDHETRENMLIQDKMKLQRDLEVAELKIRDARAAQDREKTLRVVAERTVERLESESSDIEDEINGLAAQRDQYKKLAQDLSSQVADLSSKCGELECDLSNTKRALEVTRGEAIKVKEESTEHLTRLHQLKEANFGLMADLQASVDQGQELRSRIAELEGVLEEMRQFYQEREIKAEGTRQQQTKLIDYLQLKLEETNKKKKTVCDKIFGTKQKENLPPSGAGMPVGYRELENQLARERAKVKALTDQLLTLRAAQASTPNSASPPSPKMKKNPKQLAESPCNTLARKTSLQKMWGNTPHKFDIKLAMRTGKCAACLESVHFGKNAAICSECQIMAHPKCSLIVPTTCGVLGEITRHFNKTWKASEENLSSCADSIQTLGIDQPDNPKATEFMNQKLLDLNCIVELDQERVLLLGAEEGLFSYRLTQSQEVNGLQGVSRVYQLPLLPHQSEGGPFSFFSVGLQGLTRIQGVVRVHQLSLHQHLGLALMIAGEDRQLVACELRQLKSNALAAECSRPAISITPILTDSDSCHLYQLRGTLLCAATASHVVLLKWTVQEDGGNFVVLREFATTEPCSCALFTRNLLIVGCNNFFQIDLDDYNINEFPDQVDSSLRAALQSAARVGSFPVAVLDVSSTSQSVELLLCYNEFGVFVDERGRRTRTIDPTWSHLPFGFAYRKPYLFIIHFSSVEIVKLTGESYRSSTKKSEPTLVEFNNPRYLGPAGATGIYIAAINSALEILKIDGAATQSGRTNSLTSLDTLQQDDESSSEFSFTSSLMEALDGQGKRVHFSNQSNH
ncbi:citron Rho-interacting kinase [Athalia rosae]|uniref:citron Rho-interacting kinase n=1 Tax=Athalia rosae TaxID=37344 RepID=UPI0020346C7D|nr:citron Rho-interacting kinase [Athalia rosae]XP_048506006.1 citron Rho-interacting kinase [Athalia rosae]